MKIVNHSLGTTPSQDLNQQLKKLFRTERKLFQLRGQLDKQYNRIHLLNQLSLTLSHAKTVDEVFSTALNILSKDLIVKYGVGILCDPRTDTSKAIVRIEQGSRAKKISMKLTIPNKTYEYFDTVAKLITINENLNENELAFYEAATHYMNLVFERKILFQENARLIIIGSQFVENKTTMLLFIYCPAPEQLAYLEKTPSYEDYPFLHAFSKHIENATENVLYLEKIRGINIELEKKVSDRTNELEISNKNLQDTIQQLKDAQKKLLESQKLESIGKLAGGIAHDFNNILSSILGYASIMKQDLISNPELLKKIEIIQKSAERGALLTSQLLGFARKGQYKKTILNANNAIEEVIDILTSSLDKRIKIISNYATDLWSMEGDMNQLIQTFMNVAINARDAMPNGGTLTFTTENIVADDNFCRTHPALEPGYYVRVSIIDTGIGIPHEIQEKIFDPFFTTKPIYEGTGLGLSVAYGIIQNHHGDISIYSEPGEGTRVNVYFPAVGETCKMDARKQKKTPPRIDLKTILRNKTILIVDDEETIRDLLKEMLSNATSNIIVATNGYDALKKFAENRESVDLVILDIIMPELDGISTLKRIQLENPKIKFIISSGYSENDEVKKLIEQENITYLQKPFTKKDFSEKIYSLLKNNVSDL